MSTVRWSVSTGVTTRSARVSSASPSVGQTRVQTPQPRQRSTSTRARLRFGRFGSFAETAAIASTAFACGPEHDGHAAIHDHGDVSKVNRSIHVGDGEFKYGYFVVVGLMLTACGSLYLAFKRSGWL